MRKLRRLAAAAVLLAALAAPASAAGSITVTSTTIGSSQVQYSLAWTSDAAGAVSGHALNIRRGFLLHVEFVPGSGGTQPTDLYDVQLQDRFDVDLLNNGTTAQGGNLSNSTSKIVQWNPPWYYDGLGSLELVISNAGNAKTGTVYLTVGQ